MGAGNKSPAEARTLAICAASHSGTGVGMSPFGCTTPPRFWSLLPDTSVHFFLLDALPWYTRPSKYSSSLEVHQSRRRYAVVPGGVFGTRCATRSIAFFERTSREKKKRLRRRRAENARRQGSATRRRAGRERTTVAFPRISIREHRNQSTDDARVSVFHRTNASFVNQARRVALRGAKTARAEDQIRHLMFSSSRPSVIRVESWRARSENGRLKPSGFAHRTKTHARFTFGILPG